MGFLTYSCSANTMINQIVDNFVAADAARFAKVETGSVQKACMHYTYGGEDRYIQFINKNSYIYDYTRTTLEVDIGNTYNTTTHEVETTVNKFAGLYYYNSITESTAFADRTYANTIWQDKYGIIWNMWNPYSDGSADGFLFIMEFVPVAYKEYDDASSSIIVSFTNAPNDVPYNNSTVNKCGQYASFQNNTYNLFDVSNMTKAFKSLGNNKIYFDFAKYHKNPNVYNNPIVTSKRLFLANKTGLAVNDVLTWIDPADAAIRKYIITEVGSGTGTHANYFALPYDNAKEYV